MGDISVRAFAGVIIGAALSAGLDSSFFAPPPGSSDRTIHIPYSPEKAPFLALHLLEIATVASHMRLKTVLYVDARRPLGLSGLYQMYTACTIGREMSEAPVCGKWASVVFIDGDGQDTMEAARAAAEADADKGLYMAPGTEREYAMVGLGTAAQELWEGQCVVDGQDVLSDVVVPNRKLNSREFGTLAAFALYAASCETAGVPSKPVRIHCASPAANIESSHDMTSMTYAAEARWTRNKHDYAHPSGVLEDWLNEMPSAVPGVPIETMTVTSETLSGVLRFLGMSEEMASKVCVSACMSHDSQGTGEGISLSSVEFRSVMAKDRTLLHTYMLHADPLLTAYLSVDYMVTMGLVHSVSHLTEEQLGHAYLLNLGYTHTHGAKRSVSGLAALMFGKVAEHIPPESFTGGAVLITGGTVDIRTLRQDVTTAHMGAGKHWMLKVTIQHDRWGVQMALWKDVIDFERLLGDSMQLDAGLAANRLLFVYEQALLHLRHWPDLWIEAAEVMSGARTIMSRTMLKHDMAYGALTGKEIAIGLLQRGILACPKCALLYMCLADRYEENNKRHLADAVYRRALISAPSPALFSEYMKYVSRTRSVADALSAFELACDDPSKILGSPSVPSVLYAIVARLEYHGMGRSGTARQNAINRFESGIRANPTNAELLAEYVRFLSEMGDETGKVDVINRCKDSHSDSDTWNQYLVSLQIESGKRTESQPLPDASPAEGVLLRHSYRDLVPLAPALQSCIAMRGVQSLPSMTGEDETVGFLARVPISDPAGKLRAERITKPDFPRLPVYDVVSDSVTNPRGGAQISAHNPVNPLPPTAPAALKALYGLLPVHMSAVLPPLVTDVIVGANKWKPARRDPDGHPYLPTRAV
ncbi:hypothetical protein KIPB_000364, partial [Kipferlia bialata]|eukprot:g364.t1